jgi:hypothetical protein
MTTSERHHTRSVSPRRSATGQVHLAAFDGQRMAVEMRRGPDRVVLRGTAVFVRDDAIGNTLNIRLDGGEPGHPVLVVSENEWDGRIVPDFHHGCNFCLVVD